MTMHQKVNVLIFFIHAHNGQSWKEKNKIWALFYFILLLFIFSSPKRNPFKIHYSSTSPPWTLVLFVFPTIAHLFCLSHCKTRWTMSADNVSLQTYLSRTSNSLIALDMFPLVKTEVVPRRVQQPITNFIGSWDDFTPPLPNMWSVLPHPSMASP